MKIIIILSLVALAVCAEETYSTENDNLDIEAVVADDNALKSFYECFVNKGDCSDAGKDFKKDLPEVFQTACSKCTAAQKNILKRFFEGLEKKFPAEFVELKKYYDPEGSHYSGLYDAVTKV